MDSGFKIQLRRMSNSLSHSRSQHGRNAKDSDAPPKRVLRRERSFADIYTLNCSLEVTRMPGMTNGSVVKLRGARRNKPSGTRIERGI